MIPNTIHGQLQKTPTTNEQRTNSSSRPTPPATPKDGCRAQRSRFRSRQFVWLAVLFVGGLALLALSGTATATHAPDCSAVEYEETGGIFEIETAEQLQCLEEGPGLDESYVLVADIDASETDSWNDGAGFTPIGTEPSPFSGSVDGNGHTVSGLMIDCEETRSGLFGQTDFSATVENLTLEDVEINGTRRVGGLVGFNFGTLSNVHVDGTVTGTGDYTGGVAGANIGPVSNTTSAVDVESAGNRSGGLLGASANLVVDSAATGNVSQTDGATTRTVGGLIGFNTVDGPGPAEGAVENSSATGTVTGTLDVGGLIGVNEGGLVSNSTAGDAGSFDGRNTTAAVPNEPAHWRVTGAGQVGGLIGNQTGGTVVTSAATGAVNGTEATGGLIGYSENATVTESFTLSQTAGTESVGGLVGDAIETSVHSSFATGSVDGERAVGGIAGTGTDSTIERSYAAVQLTTTDDSNGLIGVSANATVTNAVFDREVAGFDPGTSQSQRTEDMSGTAATEILEGFDFTDTWTATDGYPQLRWAIVGVNFSLPAQTLSVGETTEGTVTLERVDNHTLTGTTTATYSSADETVATVSGGSVTAEGAGETTITAETANETDTVSVSVTAESADGLPGFGFGVATVALLVVAVALGRTMR